MAAGTDRYLYLVFVLLIVIPGENGENTSNTNHQGIHVLALLNGGHEAIDQETPLMFSACRLGYTDAKVLRDWCPSGTCKEDLRLEDHLRDLPEEDWIIIINPGQEFVYLMASPEKTKETLTETGQNLILIEQPPSVNEHKERLEAKEEEEKEEEEEENKKKKREGSDDTAEHENEEKETKENKTGQEENEKDQENDDKSPTDKKRSLDESASENEINKDNKEKEGKTGNEVSGGEEKNKEEEKNLVLRALQGGTVLGRVGSVLQALRDGEMTKDSVIDTSAKHVLFGDRVKGGLGVEVPIKTTFIPDDGGEGAATSPFIVYSQEDKLDFYNIINFGGDGPEYCSFTRDQPLRQKETQPKILVFLNVATSWVPFLEEILQGLLNQVYPKERMDIWIHAKSGVQEKEIELFKENGSSYSSIEVVKDESVDMTSLRSKCVEMSCDYLVIMEPQVLLEDSKILSHLIASNRPVVGPLLLQTKKNPKGNFVYNPNESSQWDDLIGKRTIKGTFRVLEIKNFVMYRRDVVDRIMNGETPMHFVTNERKAGYIIDSRGFKEGKLHVDLWGMVFNRFLWLRRYIHPDVFKIIKKEMKAEVVGPYLNYVHIFTDRFCKEMIEEMEFYGQWYEKEKDDREVASHRYSSRNINFEEIDYADEYHVILNSVHKELLAALYDDYRGDAEASLVFVLKYAHEKNYGTFNYHLDGATYTFNIALNDAFTGGGLSYKLGNKFFDDEDEFVVPHNRTGWAVIQPDRPLHAHKGVALKTGTRYAMINIIDTNDENAKGGPKWTFS